MNYDKDFRIQLESLFDLSDKLNWAKDEQFILNSVILSLMGKLRFIRAAVFEPVFNKNNFICCLSKGKQAADTINYFEIKDLSLNPPDELKDSGYSCLIPIIYQGEVLYLIALGKAGFIKPELQNEEIHYARLVSTIAANAIKNTRNRISLIESKNQSDRRSQLLSSLFEMNNDFSTLLSKNQILRMLSYRLMGQLMVSRFAVYLLEHGHDFEVIINRFDSTPDDNLIKSFSDTEKIIKVEELHDSENYKNQLNQMGVKIISPMIVQGDVKGILLVGKKMNGEEFTDDNFQFIEVLANISMLALENERLFQEELIKKNLEREMQLALEIQKNLLPKQIPNIEGFDLDGISLPARLVGGDYFDFIPLDDDRTLIAIADVSGKGMPAALLMANVQAALRVLAPLLLPLDELVLRINSIVYHNTSPDKFVTFFCGILDKKDKCFNYLNAGHNPPYLFSDAQGFRFLTEGGIILGITDLPFAYSQGKVELNSGDVLVFYTDGVTEAMNKDREEFDEPNLQFEIVSSANESASKIMNNIIDAVKEHSKDTSQSDDITIVVLKVF